MATITATHRYPVDALDGCASALVLFAAAYGGLQDALYIRDAGLHGVCVDTNGDNLEFMKPHYPDDWVFVQDDAFDVTAGYAKKGIKFDVVSLDPYTGGVMQRVHEELGLFCSVASKAVVVGTIRGSRMAMPRSWQVADRVRRSSLADWTVLEPC